MNLDFQFVSAAMLSNFVLKGLVFSLQLTLAAMTGGIAIGTVLALMRLSANPAMRAISAAYTNTLRSIPLVMVILWFFLLVPVVLGRPLGADASAFVTFTAFEAAFYAEILRAGILSVPRGQINASYAMGMTYAQCMRWIVLPQAFRNMLPVLLTQTIVLFQDTSLVYAIGAHDLLKSFELAGKNFSRPIECTWLAAAAYFVICFTLSTLARRLHKRLAIVR